MLRVSPYVALIPICMGVFVAADDQTVIVTVLPDIMLDFRIPPTELDGASWTITAYLLGYVAAMPLIGSMSDAFGHRRMFAAAMVLFMLGSVAAALAPNLPALIGIRVFQAVGAGAM
ncbi:MAG: MFS transporter, partial [Dehalococcoidia bacterium]|nr:MFS transporter [Dehalococcoidia bacterium]